MAIATLTKNQHARTNVIPKYITMTTGVDKELTSPCNTKKRSALLPASGAWMYAFPFHLADLVSCGKPPPVLNAQDWYQFTSIGTNVTYVCDPGYTLFGSTRRTCKANGKWDGVKPYCCTFWSKYFSQSIIFFLSLIILPIWHLDLDQKVAIITFGVYCALKVESFSGITSLEWEKKNSNFFSLVLPSKRPDNSVALAFQSALSSCFLQTPKQVAWRSRKRTFHMFCRPPSGEASSKTTHS